MNTQEHVETELNNLSVKHAELLRQAYGTCIKSDRNALLQQAATINEQRNQIYMFWIPPHMRAAE